MNRRYEIKNGIGFFVVALTKFALKSFVLSVRYGADILLVEDVYNTTDDYEDVNDSDERFTINTYGCKIPVIAGGDTLTKIYFSEPKPPECQYDTHPLVASNSTHIITLKENFKFFKNISKSDIKCCYKPFYRPRLSNGMANDVVDDRIIYTKCKAFEDTLEVTDEFILVNCYQDEEVIYSKFFVFALAKMFTRHRADPLSNNQSMYNIIIIGLGSMSRQNLYRTMPKTWNLLNNLEAVELKGYNTIAKDTFQNLIAILVGLNGTELHNICYLNRRATLDRCPFIWERFKDMGYYTALAEDSTKHGMFNTETFGFRGTPTDYYMHPFIRESEIMYHNKSDLACMGDKHYFEVLLNYIDSLTTRLNTTKLFGLFWEISMSYNNLNYPQRMDDAYATLIEKLNSTGYLNKTILILLSDHGMNVGDVNLLKQGRLEQRLPISYILTPKSFREKFTVAYRNLQLNQDRLTTPFDLHSTLVDLLHMNDITDSEIIERSTEPYSQYRGISLFLKIPLNRTCEKAGISKKWCSCYDSVNLLVSNPIIGTATSFLSHIINDQLKPYRRCLKLTINKILKAYELIPGYEQNEEWRSFMIILSTVPGGGVFEAILQYNHNNNFTLVNPLKRLNASSRNYCVRNEYVKMFCYCKHRYSKM